MSDSRLEALKCKAEELEWNWYDCNDGYIELKKSSPAGEDFWIAVNAGNLVDEVRSTCDSFDTEEHVHRLLDAKENGFRGVPSLKVLVEDADDIQEMLEELADALEGVEEDG